MKCAICKIEVDEDSQCEICGVEICSSHSELNDGFLTCDYCLGKDEVFRERDEDDFAGTEM